MRPSEIHQLVTAAALRLLANDTAAAFSLRQIFCVLFNFLRKPRLDLARAFDWPEYDDSQFFRKKRDMLVCGVSRP